MSENAVLAREVKSPPSALPNLRRLLAIAAVWPAFIAAVNYALMYRNAPLPPGSWEIGVQFGWYVVQVGLTGWIIGRGLSQPVWRWVVFAWTMLLINLLTSAIALSAIGAAASLPPAALFSGQIGLCVVWAFLGDTRWRVRCPAMFVCAAAMYFFWITLAERHYDRLWTELLGLQIVTLAVLCGLLRLRGYHVARIARGPATAAEEAERRALQFNIKHVLMWTTALAAVLGLAKGLDLLNWERARELAQAGVFWKLTVATASAIVIVVALWVALGQGHAAMRYPVGIVFAVLAGSGLSLWGAHMANAITTGAWGRWNSITWDLYQWYEIRWWWLGWLFLSGGLLAATLIVLRTLDYRLVRFRASQRKASTSAATR